MVSGSSKRMTRVFCLWPGQRGAFASEKPGVSGSETGVVGIRCSTRFQLEIPTTTIWNVKYYLFLETSILYIIVSSNLL